MKTVPESNRNVTKDYNTINELKETWSRLQDFVFTSCYLMKILYGYLVRECHTSLHTSLNKEDVTLQKSVFVTLKQLQ